MKKQRPVLGGVVEIGKIAFPCRPRDMGSGEQWVVEKRGVNEQGLGCFCNGTSTGRRLIELNELKK